MRYQLTPIHCRPWLVAYLSVKFIESHYENGYGGEPRRLNAITEKLQSLNFATTPGYVINGLKRRHVRCLSNRKSLDEIGVAGQSHSQRKGCLHEHA